eukprot:jgi/Botrbrau1/3962/Bobra.0365s0035.1
MVEYINVFRDEYIDGGPFIFHDGCSMVDTLMSFMMNTFMVEYKNVRSRKKEEKTLSSDLRLMTCSTSHSKPQSLEIGLKGKPLLEANIS